MASVTARKKIVKEAGSEVEELEEQVAQVGIGTNISKWERESGCVTEGASQAK